MAEASRYDTPKPVWVEDGQVYAEGHNGAILVLSAEIALEMSRLLAAAGREILISRARDRA